MAQSHKPTRAALLALLLKRAASFVIDVVYAILLLDVSEATFHGTRIIMSLFGSRTLTSIQHLVLTLTHRWHSHTVILTLTHRWHSHTIMNPGQTFPVLSQPMMLSIRLKYKETDM